MISLVDVGTSTSAVVCGLRDQVCSCLQPSLSSLSSDRANFQGSNPDRSWGITHKFGSCLLLSTLKPSILGSHKGLTHTQLWVPSLPPKVFGLLAGREPISRSSVGLPSSSLAKTKFHPNFGHTSFVTWLNTLYKHDQKIHDDVIMINNVIKV